MFATLEATAVATWVAESLWGYPVMLSLHVVGLAVVVGIFSMRDMRLLGLFAGIQPSAFLPLSKLAWVGFILNAVSGFALFSSQAVTFAESVPFLIKIASIVMAMVLAGFIQARLRNELELSSADAAISKSTKLMAMVSLILWMTAIIAGRLIAYIL